MCLFLREILRDYAFVKDRMIVNVSKAFLLKCHYILINARRVLFVFGRTTAWWVACFCLE